MQPASTGTRASHLAAAPAGFNKFFAYAYGVRIGWGQTAVDAIKAKFGAPFDPMLNDATFTLSVTTLEVSLLAVPHVCFLRAELHYVLHQVHCTQQPVSCMAPASITRPARAHVATASHAAWSPLSRQHVSLCAAPLKD